MGVRLEFGSGDPLILVISSSASGLYRSAQGHDIVVRKLVFLDALDIGAGGWAKIPQPPLPPEDTPADLASSAELGLSICT
jgi:hypothetical protein